MAFKPKKDPATGQPVWKDDKPVFINDQTGNELEIDVTKLFDDNATLRHEAQTNRERAEAAEKAAKTWEGKDPAQVTKDLAELARLKAEGTKPGSKQMSDEELDKLVAERAAAALAAKDTEIEGLKTKVTNTEKERDTAMGEHQSLLLDTEAMEAIGKVGIRKENVDDAKRLIREAWKVDKGSDGKPTVLKRDASGKVVMGTDPTKPLSIEEDLRQLVRGDKKVWLTPASGTEHILVPDAPGVDLNSLSTSQLFQVGLPTNGTGA